ncbi:hypothetical protein Tco_0727815 [Tanacetum coccineum]|uniref:Uncharacterized protein n=1 Tax=Tanacetum coccineum TaxID=301880 RepID=A0ABQ4YJD3_9ASTR
MLEPCGSSFLDGVIFLFFKLLLGILSMIGSKISKTGELPEMNECLALANLVAIPLLYFRAYDRVSFPLSIFTPFGEIPIDPTLSREDYLSNWEENLKENISSGTLLVFKEPSIFLPPLEPPDECLKNVVLNFYQSKKTFPLNVEDVNSFAFIIWTFLPFFTYTKTSPMIFSFQSENFVFDPGIITFHNPAAVSMKVWICQILQEISQKRTRERMSDQEAKEIKAEAKRIMPQPSAVNYS